MPNVKQEKEKKAAMVGEYLYYMNSKDHLQEFQHQYSLTNKWGYWVRVRELGL